MEVIRKLIDVHYLISVMALPEAFRNRKLEVIVFPAEEDTTVQRKANVPDIVRSLAGTIPHTDLTVSELRDERLWKHETAH